MNLIGIFTHYSNDKTDKSRKINTTAPIVCTTTTNISDVYMFMRIFVMFKTSKYTIFNHSFKFNYYESIKNRFFCKNSIYSVLELYVDFNSLDYNFAQIEAKQLFTKV